MKKYKLVDLFAGCGGLSLGLEQAGFTPWFVNEIVEHFANTYKVNHQLSDEHYFIGDIASLNEHIDEYKELLTDVTLVCGGPPCQGFSMANRQRILDDPRNNLYKQYLIFLKHVRPRFFIMENVKGMMNKKDEIVQNFKEYLGEEYLYDYAVLKAQDFGVPQNRERFIMIGNRMGISPNEIMLPKNLYIIGTINVDETTYMFSPKVLDRAHVIEFKIAADEMASFLEADKMVNRHACHGDCAGMAEDFLARTNAYAVGVDTSNVQDTLNGFFKELKSVNAEFGYRTASEIYRYINNVGDELGEHGAIDTAILQKLLPKLHGSRKKLSPVLNALWKLCFAENSSISIESVKEFAEIEGIIYKHTAEKIFRMYKAVVDNGFTSFAEA